MNLNAWQRVDRVLPGLPFGDGKDGDATVSSDPNTRATFTGNATDLTGTAGSTSFANGDLVKIIQTQGSGAGQYEYNLITAGGGTTSLTFLAALHYNYVGGAQIIKVPRYLNATLNAHSVTSWAGSTGGHGVVCARVSLTVNQAVSAAAAGFRGGAAVSGGNSGKQGESYNDNSQSTSTASNEDGGGGGQAFSGGSGSGAGGGSGGHSGAGQNGHIGNNGETGGTAGQAATDSSDATNIQFGGGGGSGGSRSVGGNSGRGGVGGGIYELISDNIILNNTVSVDGENGVQGSQGGQASGAPGAGGFIVGICRVATLGTNQLLARKGSGVGGNGGDGASNDASDGRITIHHSGSVGGSTNPSFTDISDATLIESTGGFLAFM